jgi:hypothetical protein
MHHPIHISKCFHFSSFLISKCFASGPVEVLLAAKFATEDGFCGGLIYNLLYQAAITEIGYLLLGPLNLRFISPMTPKKYYRFVFPSLCVILAFTVISVNYEFNVYLQMTLCSLGTCLCYYAACFDYYVTFAETVSLDIYLFMYLVKEP